VTNRTGSGGRACRVDAANGQDGLTYRKAVSRALLATGRYALHQAVSVVGALIGGRQRVSQSLTST
jgi:hypothetical protein